MQRAAYRFGVIATLLLSICLISGCSGSSSDPLEEAGLPFYISDIDVQDRGESVNEIDIFQDCDNDLINGADGEDLLTSTTITLTFASDTDTEQDLYIYQVEFDFILEDYTPDGAPAPVIQSKTFPNLSIRVPSGGGSSNPDRGIFDLMTASVDKPNYIDYLGGDAVAITYGAEFRVRITAKGTFSPSDPEEHRVIRDSYSNIVIDNFAHSSCEEEEETP